MKLGGTWVLEGFGLGNLYSGGCFVLRGLVPKVVRKMAEIWCFLVDWTNLQLVVLKILMVVSCEGKDVFVRLWVNQKGHCFCTSENATWKSKTFLLNFQYVVALDTNSLVFVPELPLSLVRCFQ